MATFAGTPEAAARAFANLSRGDGEEAGLTRASKKGALARRAAIDAAGGVKWLVHMLDGSNLSQVTADQ